MQIKDVLAVSGLPGLYKLVNSRNNGLFVQDLDGGKTKFCSSRKHQFTPLETVAIYTVYDTVELKEVFEKMKAYAVNNEIVAPNESKEAITAFFTEVLPEYDRDRVYVSDMKKIVKWYNYLNERQLLEGSDEEE